MMPEAVALPCAAEVEQDRAGQMRIRRDRREGRRGHQPNRHCRRTAEPRVAEQPQACARQQQPNQDDHRSPVAAQLVADEAGQQDGDDSEEREERVLARGLSFAQAGDRDELGRRPGVERLAQ